MKRSGSIAIAHAVFSGRGLLMAATGLLVLVASAVTNAEPSHVAAALVFAVGMVALRVLAQSDSKNLNTPWSNIVRLTDLLSLLVLSVATFGPLVLVAVLGHPDWDVPVLAGVLLIWWSCLDILIADYRRIRVAIVLIALAWTPLLFVDATTVEIAHWMAGFAVLALGVSAWALRRAFTGVPTQYRIIDVENQDDAA